MTIIEGVLELLKAKRSHLNAFRWSYTSPSPEDDAAAWRNRHATYKAQEAIVEEIIKEISAAMLPSEIQPVAEQRPEHDERGYFIAEVGGERTAWIYDTWEEAQEVERDWNDEHEALLIGEASFHSGWVVIPPRDAPSANGTDVLDIRYAFITDADSRYSLTICNTSEEADALGAEFEEEYGDYIDEGRASWTYLAIAIPRK